MLVLFLANMLVLLLVNHLKNENIAPLLLLYVSSKLVYTSTFEWGLAMMTVTYLPSHIRSQQNTQTQFGADQLILQ